MKYLCIRGGRALNGAVSVQGAKNAVLPLLAAALAVADRCTLENCPDIRDVHIALELLRSLGCRAAFADGTVEVDSTDRSGTALDPALAGRMRASVLFLGALTAAAGRAEIPLPGGCCLGERPLDLHLRALEALGATITERDGSYACRAERLRGTTVLLRYPSVGATENLMLAALAAEGETTLLGAAREPEITELAAFLNACGARIFGAGSSTLHIRGGALHGCRWRVMPDRMAAATLLCAAASAGGDVLLERVRPCELEPVTAALRRAGCTVQAEEETVRLRAGRLHAIPPIVTAPYPGFPTDAQAPLMAALLKAEGTTVLEETVFENRFRHVPALRRLGGNVRLAGRMASICGVPALHGCRMEATDLRGGAAMLIGALGALGESRLENIGHLERGYAQLSQTLRLLGADVRERYDEPEP